MPLQIPFLLFNQLSSFNPQLLRLVSARPNNAPLCASGSGSRPVSRRAWPSSSASSLLKFEPISDFITWQRWDIGQGGQLHWYRFESPPLPKPNKNSPPGCWRGHRRQTNERCLGGNSVMARYAGIVEQDIWRHDCRTVPFTARARVDEDGRLGWGRSGKAVMTSPRPSPPIGSGSGADPKAGWDDSTRTWPTAFRRG